MLGGAQEGVSLATLSALLEMMEEKERMVRLLNQYIDGPGLTVVIGAEHTAPNLRALSLVASTVVDEGATRTVGVIGPLRMHYSRAIALDSNRCRRWAESWEILRVPSCRAAQDFIHN